MNKSDRSKKSRKRFYCAYLRFLLISLLLIQAFKACFSFIKTIVSAVFMLFTVIERCVRQLLRPCTRAVVIVSSGPYWETCCLRSISRTLTLAPTLFV